MSEPLEERYFAWLYSRIGSVKLRNPTRTFWKLSRQLHSKEFVWFVPNDDNRVEDGRNLRLEFLHAENIVDVDPEWMALGCSMFELLIALSERLTFEADSTVGDWFRHLINNIGLIDYNDKNRYNEDYINEILDCVIWRRYEPSGRGGLFPLSNPASDQRQVELWYQLSSYLLEHYR